MKRRKIALLMAGIMAFSASYVNLSTTAYAAEEETSIAEEETAIAEDETVITDEITSEEETSEAEEEIEEEETEEVYPDSISILASTSKKAFNLNATFTVKVNGYSPIQTTNLDVVWSSSNPSVMSVDEDGLVTCLAEGKATITATSVGLGSEGNYATASTIEYTVYGATEDGFIYTSTSDSTVSIVDYDGSAAEIVIPSVIDGKQVTSLATLSFWMNDDITSVVIPEGVTSIGKQAFNGDTNLASITLPSTLTTIGQRAFWGTAIKSITVPEGVTSLGNEAFSTCRSLEEISLPESLTSIGANCFSGDSKLVITLPNNITYIGNNAFRNVNTLKAFPGTTTAATLESKNIAYTDANVYPDSISISASTSKKAFNLNETFTVEINGYAPEETNNLNVVWSSSDPSVMSVDEDGVVTCLAEGKATITATSVGLGSEGTYATASTIEYTVYGATEDGFIYTSTSDTTVSIVDYDGDATEVVIPAVIDGKQVTSLGTLCFWMNDDITSVVIPEGVTSIGKQAFNGDTNLASITLPSTLTTIGQRAFWGTAIETITVPEGVTSLSNEAFSNCKSLKEISLPESLTSIGANCFSNDASLVITLPNNISSIGNNAFRNVNTVKAYPGTVTAATLESKGITYTDAYVYPTSIILKNLEGKAGTSVQLNIEYDNQPDYIDIEYSIDNENVAKIDENGNITCLKAGKATITVTAYKYAADGEEKEVATSGTCTINVKPDRAAEITEQCKKIVSKVITQIQKYRECINILRKIFRW